MKWFYPLLCIAALSSSILAASEADGLSLVASNDVVWKTLGTNENDSMPIGNGDLAVNVWTEQNGDVMLLLSKADSWTEMGKLVKLGRVRIKLAPSPFVASSRFTQILAMEKGAIEMKSDTGSVRVWADANYPVVRIEAHSEQPVSLEAALELWRTNSVPFSKSPQRGGMFEFGGHGVPMDFWADTVLTTANRVTWCHFNSNSIYPLVLKQEHLESLLTKHPDPLLHRCFGASIFGPGLMADGDHHLRSPQPRKDLRVDIVGLTQNSTESVESWRKEMETSIQRVGTTEFETARNLHEEWWATFWNRSWIQVSGSPDAVRVSQGYDIQRWMMACSSRGEQPTKFNGGLFTVGHDITGDQESNQADHDPDYRLWGNCYWNQNNRLIYWPLIVTGDSDLMKPWFQMYAGALALVKDRTRLYYQHDGAAFPETMYFWGLPNLGDFGWNNPSNQIQSPWIRHHLQGSLEVIAQALDVYEFTQDDSFAHQVLVPISEAVVTYYDQHWTRDAKGKIRMAPVQSLETYQETAVNPTPDIAGLKSVLPRLLALPGRLTIREQRDVWGRVLRDLPPIPMGKTAKGKVPPQGKGDENGDTIILPAEEYGKTCNVENPELYVAFPYHLYGVGKPDLELGRRTYAARLFRQDACWGQDGTQAATLGLTSEAQRIVRTEFTKYGEQRFSWFWKSSNDWIPDLDNGGSGMITLQQMLMQYDGKRILLLPAWPTNWTAEFKLHAPFQTTVQGHVEVGKISNLIVMPKTREKDVEIIERK